MNACIISCNIRYDNPSDGDNSWHHRKELLTQTLLSHSPDIIATQEGRFDQLYELNSLLNDFEIIDTHRSWIKPRMYPSFFIRKNTFEIIGSGDIWLSETPKIAGSSSFNSTFPRLMTWLKIQPTHSLTPLTLINTHLDHINPETRLGQIEVLIKETTKILEMNSPLLIFGDFNDSPASLIRKKIEGHFSHLQDSWKMFNSDEETSHHAFNGEFQNGSRIDWILVDNSLQVLSCQLDKTHLNGKYPTDHFPVVCKLKL